MLLENIYSFQFLPDIFNFFFLFLFVFYFSIKYQIGKKYFIIFSIFLLSPFFFYWLWEWTFLPDQSKYSQLIYDFRHFQNNEIISSILRERVVFSSLLLALFPIPFVTTIVSISLINKGILLMTIFYFLKQNKYYFLIYLLLFLPSMIVISSLALRDMLVLVIAIFFFYFFLEKKNYLRSVFFGILFLLVKPHLATIFVTTAVGYYIFFEKFNSSKTNKFLFILSFLIPLLILIYFTQEKLISIKHGFLAEEYGYQLLKKDDFEMSISLIVSSFINFLFSPISTNVINFINILIFLENIFITIVTIVILKFIYQENKNKAIFWILVWISTFLIFGFMLNNAGTIWRYKFLIQFSLLCAIYFCYKRQKSFFKLIITNEKKNLTYHYKHR
jgi:hypothetical protein